LGLNERASAINVYDYGLGSGRFTLHMCCILHMIPAIGRDGNVSGENGEGRMYIPDSTNTKPYYAETNLHYAGISRICMLNRNRRKDG